MREVDVQSLKAKHTSEISALQMSHMETQSHLKAKYDEEMSRLQNQFEFSQSSLNTKLNELQSDLSKTQSENASLKSDVKETAAELNRANSELSRIKISLESEIADRRRLEDLLRTSEKECMQLTSRCDTLQQQVKDKDDLVQQTLALRKAAEEAKALSEEKLEIFASTLDAYQEKLEMSSNEINKGNNVIAKLSADAKQLKEKLQLKSEVIRRQVEIKLCKAIYINCILLGSSCYGVTK